MTSDAVQVGVAVAATAVALAVAARARSRERTAAVQASLDLTGFDGRVLLFTAPGCRRCGRVRAMLDAAGIRFAEHSFEHDAERLHAAGVTAVPLLVGRDAAGREVDRIAGQVRPRSLRRFRRRVGDAQITSV